VLRGVARESELASKEASKATETGLEMKGDRTERKDLSPYKQHPNAPLTGFLSCSHSLALSGVRWDFACSTCALNRSGVICRLMRIWRPSLGALRSRREGVGVRFLKSTVGGSPPPDHGIGPPERSSQARPRG
jgi:hypothetical protein